MRLLLLADIRVCQRCAVTSSRVEVPVRLPRSGGNKTLSFGGHRSSRSREDDKFQEQSTEDIPSFLAAGLDCPSGSRTCPIVCTSRRITPRKHDRLPTSFASHNQDLTLIITQDLEPRIATAILNWISPANTIRSADTYKVHSSFAESR